MQMIVNSLLGLEIKDGIGRIARRIGCRAVIRVKRASIDASTDPTNGSGWLIADSDPDRRRTG